MHRRRVHSGRSEDPAATGRFVIGARTGNSQERRPILGEIEGCAGSRSRFSVDAAAGAGRRGLDAIGKGGRDGIGRRREAEWLLRLTWRAIGRAGPCEICMGRTACHYSVLRPRYLRTPSRAMVWPLEIFHPKS